MMTRLKGSQVTDYRKISELLMWEHKAAFRFLLICWEAFWQSLSWTKIWSLPLQTCRLTLLPTFRSPLCSRAGFVGLGNEEPLTAECVLFPSWEQQKQQTLFSFFQHQQHGRPLKQVCQLMGCVPTWQSYRTQAKKDPLNVKYSIYAFDHSVKVLDVTA